MFERRKTRPVRVGSVTVGGDAPISVQSMTTTKTTDIYPTLNQIRNMEVAGCDIVRVTVPDEESLAACPQIQDGIKIPLVADIHFNYRIALARPGRGRGQAAHQPRQHRGPKRVEAVVQKATETSASRSGSASTPARSSATCSIAPATPPRGLVESALRHCAILERMDFHDIMVSLKSSSVPLMIEAYRRLADQRDYPLHLGVTEAGPVESGTIKSAIGIGTLLAEGIGDTIRISLADDPVNEIRVARRSCSPRPASQRDQRHRLPLVRACRDRVHKLADKVEKRTAHMDKNITIAVMGCAVNGPGESREADIGSPAASTRDCST